MHLNPPEVPPKAAETLRRAMSGFEPRSTGRRYVGSSSAYQFEVPDDVAPEPGVLYYLLSQALGFSDVGRSEKTAWEVVFSFDGIPSSIALQKFGLRLYLDPARSPSAPEAKEVARKLVRALGRGMRILERSVLRDYARAQMLGGNVTLLNQSRRLRDMYEYFRGGALIAYEGEGRLSGPGGPARLFGRETEGFYNTVAMVTSYFSWAEHVFVLAHPFAEEARARDRSIASFMTLGWREKFKAPYDLAEDADAARAYSHLDAVAEGYRNPWAHGALDPRGGAVAFHLPGSGAIAMSLRGDDFTPSLYLLPFDRRGFERVDAAFTAVDLFLHTHSRTRLPMRWIEHGLDVQCDFESRRNYALAMSDEDHFEDLMEYEARLWELHVNMDY